MGWSKHKKAPLLKSTKINIPHGLWYNCKNCGELFYHKDFVLNNYVCPKCQYHYQLKPIDRLRFLIDDFEQIKEFDTNLKTSDPLKFVDSKKYTQRLDELYKIQNKSDAFLSVKAYIKNISVLIGIFDFSFMAGTMGIVEGEKISRLFLKASKDKLPVIIFSSSGGARMQEGIFSLIQMAKTCSSLRVLKNQNIPFISVLTSPSTGGVVASFGLLGDVNIAEPGALIGFAGPRVIKETIKQDLPKGFQKSEYLLENGLLDMICHRKDQKDTIYNILSILTNK